MPYISKEKRHDIDNNISEITNAGELNYAITQLLKKYLEINGKSYSKINDILGALEGAKLEFYRRVAAPYEDIKIVTNGDAY